MSLLDSMMSMLGNQTNLGALGQLLGNGGLEKIMGQLSSGGLAEVAQSWISNGPNMAVSAEQLQSALGPELAGSLSQLIGGGDMGALAQKLPELVNQLTPNGTLEGVDIGSIIETMTKETGGLGGLGSMLGGLFKS